MENCILSEKQRVAFHLQMQMQTQNAAANSKTLTILQNKNVDKTEK